jgi:hypothetical protein
MRHSWAALVLLLLAPPARAQCPSDVEFEEKPSSSHWLEGTVGSGRVRMHLERGGAVVAGVYYYTRHWDPLLLRGEWLGEGELRLTEQKPDDTETGRFEGVLGTRGFEGHWISPDGKKRWPVRLRSVPAPGCDGGGPWKTFDDPSWAFTFSYPASWRLTIVKGAAVLTCPDPSPMLFDGSGVVQVEAGAGFSSFEEGEQPFARCRGQWFIADMASCPCDDLGTLCAPVAPQLRDGLTVLRGGGSSRTYCRGGSYVGLGWRENHLVLLGDRWVTLAGDATTETVIARMAATVKAR